MQSKLTYSNVVATIALFFALTGGAAYAAGKLKIQSGDIASRAVKAGKIAPRAVKSGKIALGAVGTDQLVDGAVTRPKIATGAVGSAQVQDGSIELTDLKDPVGFVASPVGGAISVADAGTLSYPLSNATWLQRAGEFDVIFGQVEATLQAVDGGTCAVEVRLNLNGRQAGGSYLQTSSSTPEHIVTGLGGDPRINFDEPTFQELTMTLSSNGCQEGSSIDRTRARILGIG